jgi:hypothetical protein
MQRIKSLRGFLLGVVFATLLLNTTQAEAFKKYLSIDPDIQAIADNIANVDHTPQSHRDAINALLVGLGSTERAMPTAPSDERIEIPVLTEENTDEVVFALRRAVIRMGIAKEPE